MQHHYIRPRRISNVDYLRAFQDSHYGRIVEEDDSDLDNLSDTDSAIYSDDEEVTALVQSFRDQLTLPSFRQPTQRAFYSHTDGQDSYRQLPYNSYENNYSSAPVKLSSDAMDYAQRFIDLLHSMDSTKDNVPEKRASSMAHSSWHSARIEPQQQTYYSDINDYGETSAKTKNAGSSKNICRFIYKGMIGLDSLIHGPFGPRNLVYCDFTASGKPLKFIEQYIKQYVLPTYANTHSESSDSAIQTNRFREEAREIIWECVNGSEDDIVIFTGSGSTSAISKIIEVMKASKNFDFKSVAVMVSTYEHHSNLLPWENAQVGAVVTIPLNKAGLLDMEELSRQCHKYHSKGYIIIGSISAASNVTGVLTDVNQVAEIIHYYDGYAFFDYACGAPYLKMDMNPPAKYASKDAIFLSVHKFVGGPSTPGVLVAKKFLFKNATPSHPSGGTVAFVSRSIVKYIEDPIAREEGGTPEIIGSIRAGLAFKLKSAVRESYIHTREKELVRQFMDRFKSNPLIKILGSHTADRLSIFSFVVLHPTKRLYIHHNFIGLLLNDLFGIQCRPGCACAGPYAMELLEVDENVAVQSAKYFTKDCKNRGHKISILKQGFVRANLPYFYPQRMIDYIIGAIEFVVNYGWHFLPQYTYSAENGFWMHRHFNKSYISLKDISYSDKAMNVETYDHQQQSLPDDPFEAARHELQKTGEKAAKINFSSDPRIMLDEGDQHLRWFLLPHEASYYMATSTKR